MKDKKKPLAQCILINIGNDSVLGEDVPIKRARKTGPTGKVRKIFDEVEARVAAREDC